jgi:hypothetical protein
VLLRRGIRAVVADADEDAGQPDGEQRRLAGHAPFDSYQLLGGSGRQVVVVRQPDPAVGGDRRPSGEVGAALAAGRIAPDLLGAEREQVDQVDAAAGRGALELSDDPR